MFNSGGKWDFLFGKMLLELFKAVHDYKMDEIAIQGTRGEATLKNHSHMAHQLQIILVTPAPICIVTEEALAWKE